MANVNLALEDIITTQKKGSGGRRNRLVGGNGGGRRSGGGNGGGGGGFGRAGRSFGREKYFSDDTPSGKWKHDKFADLYGGGKKRAGGLNGGGGGPLRRSRTSAGATSEIVKLNISNLPETVLTADLEELFQDFGVFGVAVHYDEAGQHLGTADLFVDMFSAKDIIREYANIAIDGQEINIAVVDESGALKPRIQDRIRRVASNPIRGRKNQLQRRSPPAKRIGGRGNAAGGGGGGGGAKGGAKPKLKQMTADELDKELEAYMGSRTA